MNMIEELEHLRALVKPFQLSTHVGMVDIIISDDPEAMIEEQIIEVCNFLATHYGRPPKPPIFRMRRDEAERAICQATYPR